MRPETIASTLLLLSDRVLSVRDAADLVRILLPVLKEHLFVKQLFISQFSESLTTHQVLACKEEAPIFTPLEFPIPRDNTFPVHDGIADVVLANQEPVYVELQPLIQQGQVPEYISFWYQKGFSAMWGVSLKK